MSVLIKHMAMPKGCIYANDKDQTEYCPLLNHDDVPFCQYIENEPEIAIGIDERPVYCPLSDVPEPCEDAVSRKAMIDALEKYFDGLPIQVRYDLIEITNKLPSVISSAQPEQRWIPVTERLPEANGRYLITRGLNACGAMWNRVYIANYSDLMGLKSERIWWNGNVGKSDFERIDDVIAWMPLPEPYRAEGDCERC